MKPKALFALWGGLFSLCAGLGFIPAPSGGLRLLLTALSVLFFLPPALLIFQAGNRNDTATLKLIRNLAALSLGCTAALLVGNFLTAMTSELLGTLLYYILIVVSSPMVCSGYWVLSLFLWACLLTVCGKLLRKK